MPTPDVNIIFSFFTAFLITYVAIPKVIFFSEIYLTKLQNILFSKKTFFKIFAKNSKNQGLGEIKIFGFSKDQK